MNKRQISFKLLASHPWFGKVYRRMPKNVEQLCVEFMEKHAELDHGQFILAVNRMFLDQQRPKGWEIALDLLTAASVATDMSERSLQK